MDIPGFLMEPWAFPCVARRPDDRANCFFLELAPQKTVADRGLGRRAAATFDWSRKLTVELGFGDICEILAVLEGRSDRAGAPRNGLFHDTGAANTLITFQQEAAGGGVLLGLSRKGAADKEAIGLRHILQTGLFFVCFHTHLFAPDG